MDRLTGHGLEARRPWTRQTRRAGRRARHEHGKVRYSRILSNTDPSRVGRAGGRVVACGGARHRVDGTQMRVFAPATPPNTMYRHMGRHCGGAGVRS